MFESNNIFLPFKNPVPRIILNKNHNNFASFAKFWLFILLIRESSLTTQQSNIQIIAIHSFHFPKEIRRKITRLALWVTHIVVNLSCFNAKHKLKCSQNKCACINHSKVQNKASQQFFICAIKSKVNDRPIRYMQIFNIFFIYRNRKAKHFTWLIKSCQDWPRERHLEIANDKSLWKTVTEEIERNTDESLKWIICFSTIFLRVFFDKTAVISSLNNENLLAILWYFKFGDNHNRNCDFSEVYNFLGRSFRFYGIHITWHVVLLVQ